MSKVTMKDIAKKLNLSINAVSLSINGKQGVSAQTRLTVLTVAEELGYFQGKTRYSKALSSVNICVLVRSAYIKNSSFYTVILSTAQKEAQKYGYEFLVHFVGDTFGLPACITERRVTGVLVLGKIDDSYLTLLSDAHIPTVLVDHTSHLRDFDCILSDNVMGGVQVVLHLLQNGYKNIGFFGDLAYSESIKGRFRGYYEMLFETGEFSDFQSLMAYVIQYSILNDVEKAVIDHDHSFIQNKLEALERLPDAFFCSNDEAARQLIYALQNMGVKVPDDMGVAGFDDGSLATMFIPKLTSVHVPQELMGEKAIQRLLWKIDHMNAPTERVLLDVKLHPRESTMK